MIDLGATLKDCALKADLLVNPIKIDDFSWLFGILFENLRILSKWFEPFAKRLETRAFYRTKQWAFIDVYDVLSGQRRNLARSKVHRVISQRTVSRLVIFSRVPIDRRRIPWAHTFTHTFSLGELSCPETFQKVIRVAAKEKNAKMSSSQTTNLFNFVRARRLPAAPMRR